MAIATAYDRNKKAIKRVENKKESIFFSIIIGISVLKSHAKVGKNVDY
jgi:hypothetical protein